MAVTSALAVRIARVWSELPGTMGSNFGAAGQATAFMAKGEFFLVMGLVGGGTVALLFAVPMFSRRVPKHMLNVPNREYWMATDARRVEVLDRLASLLGWMSMATAALLAIAVELSVRANLDGTHFANGPFMVCLIVYFVFVIVLMFVMMRALSVPDAETSG